ncbi:VOC family protein [Undibacterium sp. Ji50W]|uniref:VOC family protein n=1 Tax=Undibacterium sp. Ji50W TaxID=3413041 RepID=UPI003BF0B1F6
MSSLPLAIPGAVIYAKNLTGLRHFYAQITHCDVSQADATYAILTLAQFQLVIHAIPRHIAESINIKTPPERRGDTAIKLILPVTDISQARQTAARLGGQIDAPEREWEFQHCRICDGHDPEGNVFQVRATLP